MSPPLTADDVERLLPHDALLGRPVQAYPVAVSTDSLALSWGRQGGGREGALVVADVELSARGRRGVPWRSAPGTALAASVILRPELPPAGEGLLWLLVSAAAADGIEAATGAPATLKWPNDVFVDGSQVGLVTASAHLAPSRIELAVLTVRLNVDAPAGLLPAGAANIPGVVDRAALLAAVLARLEQHYQASVPDLLDAYRRRCTTLGRQVRADLMPKGEILGRGEDVDEAGRLVIATARGPAPVGVEGLKRLVVEE